jgi:hypothetical protein
MRHGLDFVDLENPKVRSPTVHVEEWIMIGAETPRCAPTMDGGVEQTPNVDARNCSRVRADANCLRYVR